MDTSTDLEPVVQAGAGCKVACKRRILVVDDNEDIAESSAWLLRCHGHEVSVAFTGLGAVECAKRVQPDVALLDVGLPDINGYEVARRLRAEFGTGVLLIIVTAYSREFRREQAEEGLFDHFFMKPLDFSAISSLLA
jgi:DNA-binding response OmpR family regulator